MNEDYEYKIGLCKKLSTIVKSQVTTVRTRTRSNLHRGAIFQRRSQEANTSSS